jgi:DNA polymerase-3 subunit gamma/tau
VIEIDAASNNSVDNIRELQDSVLFAPIYGGYKVYIIDEIHMLSPGAFNALLKTLEEPPERVVFILATTEAHKLPATIISRCLRLDFKRVSAEAIKSGMERVCCEMGISAENDALVLLASNAEGSVRDGLSLLDQCISAGGGSITREIVLELLGSPSVEQLTELTDLVAGAQVSEALMLLEDMLINGKEERQIIRDWIEHFRNLMLVRHVKHPEDMLIMPLETVEALKSQSMEIQPEFLKECIFTLAKTLNDIRWSATPRVLLEVCLIQLASRYATEKPQIIERKVKLPGAQVGVTVVPVADASGSEKVTTPRGAETHEPRSSEADVSSVCNINWDEVLNELAATKPTLKRLVGRCRFSMVSPGRVMMDVFDDILMDTIKDKKDIIENTIRNKASNECCVEYRLTKADLPEAKKSTPQAKRPEIQPNPAIPDHKTPAKIIKDFGETESASTSAQPDRTAITRTRSDMNETGKPSASAAPDRKTSEQTAKELNENKGISSNTEEIASQIEKMFNSKIEIE